MSDETRYCCLCDQTTAEWFMKTNLGTGNPVETCPECLNALYRSHEAYVGEMTAWLPRVTDLDAEEVEDFLFEHGNPGKGQALAIAKHS